MSFLRVVFLLVFYFLSHNINAQELIDDSSTYFVDGEKRLHIKLQLKDKSEIKLKGPDFITNSNYKISKDNQGNWEVVTPPMPIGFHYFWIEVDGKKYLIPNHETYFGYNQPVNGFEIDSNDSFFKNKTRKKGKIEKLVCYDADESEFFLYKPFGFSSKKSYPLLILFHGSGENATGWIKQGKIQNILDNMIARKKIAPLIVLMVNGDIANEKNYSSIEEGTLAELPIIENQLMTKILPNLQQKFHFSQKSIAGLSKGSYQAFKIGTDYSGFFSEVGLFSPVLYSEDSDDKFKNINKEAFSKQSYFLSVGDLEDDRFLNFKSVLEEQFKKNNVEYESYISPNTYHEWLTWRRSLYNFLIWKK